MTTSLAVQTLPAHHFASLATLEVAIRLAAHAAQLSFPAIHKVAWPQEPPEIATARAFVDQCDVLLAVLDAYRDAVAPDPSDDCFGDSEDDDIPF